jgi:hypothetical protein
MVGFVVFYTSDKSFLGKRVEFSGDKLDEQGFSYGHLWMFFFSEGASSF